MQPCIRTHVASRRAPFAFLTLILLLFVTACADTESASVPDAEEGDWIVLFDGQSLDQWTALGRDSIPQEHWRIEDGVLRKVASGDVPVAADGQPLEGGDIMTRDTFRDFELEFEWRVAPGANSGVKYNVSEQMSTSAEPYNAALGFEYQVLDDSLHADGELPSHRTAALYDMLAPNDDKQMNPVGEWNQSRILFDGDHGEHWLNGQKVVEYHLGTARFDSLLSASKYATVEGFADKREGHIVLQDHGDDVWFRNIRVRRLGGQ